MEGPREIAWQHRCDYHSHINAIRVAFAATYAQAIPNARRAQYYKTKLPSVNRWVTGRKEHEKATLAAKEESGGNGPEEGVMELHCVIPTCIAVDDKERTGKRRTQSKNTEAAIPKRKRTELQLLLNGRGLSVEMDDSGVFMAGDEEGDADVSGGDLTDEIPLATGDVMATPMELNFVELLPISTTAQVTKKNRTRILPQVPRNKKTRFSSRSNINITLSDSNSSAGPSKLPKSSKSSAKSTFSKKGEKQEKRGREISYEILPHCPGATEVIFDRYPVLHKLSRSKRGKKCMSASTGKDTRKMPDLSRLIFLCRKASNNQNKPMKAGIGNSALGGSRQLIFLRRNVSRVEKLGVV